MTRAARTLACALALAALAAGCGGGSTSSTTSSASTATSTSSATTTVTISQTRPAATTTTTTSRSSPPPTTTSTTTSSAAATTTTTTTTTPTVPATTTTSSTTRTETGPAFVGGGSPTGALATANAVLTRRGFVAVSLATYGAPDTLHVLIGRAAAGGERAFFFNEGRFIGTDSPQPSARIVVVAHSDSEVTLAYDVYAAGARAPSGQRRVSFALDMGQLSALGPLPSAAERR
jgi:hypothetical protein